MTEKCPSPTRYFIYANVNDETCGVFIFQRRWFFSFIRTDDAACDPCPSPPSPIITRHDETAYYCRGFAARYYRVYALAAPAETRGNFLLRPRRRSALTSFWPTRRERGGARSGGEVVAPQRREPESGRNVVSRLNRRRRPPRVRPSRTDGLCRSCVSISSRPAVETANPAKRGGDRILVSPGLTALSFWGRLNMTLCSTGKKIVSFDLGKSARLETIVRAYLEIF